MATDVIGAILVLVVLVAIVWIMVRPVKDSPDDRNFLGKTGSRFFWGTFVQGILSAVALGAGVQQIAGGWASGITSGAVTGILFALLTGTESWRESAMDVISGLLGALGIIVSIAALFSPQGQCTPADIGQRVLTFALVATALVVGAVVAWFGGHFRAAKLGRMVLAAFGALAVVEFLSSPLGVSLMQLGATGWVISLVAALALGFAASIWPEFTIAVAAVAVAVASVTGAVAGSASCLPGPDLSGLSPIIGFVVLYFVARFVLGRLVRSTSPAQ